MISPEASCESVYTTVAAHDERWGMVCTTVGFQSVPPRHPYPVSQHPSVYGTVKSGRTLDEYQLVYIVEGEGTFRSASCPPTRVSGGTVILLFPDEWHSYSPDPDTGWREWWVGFRGTDMDNRVSAGFFDRRTPLLHIGYSLGIEECYNEIFRSAKAERSGFQQLVSGIVIHMLGSMLFKHGNSLLDDKPMTEIIDRAREMMRCGIDENLSPEEIARRLNVGYTTFRCAFKQYVGIPPAQYQIQLRFNKAKDLLENSSMSIKEIAYALNFDGLSRFSAFFRQRSGKSPSEYRARRIRRD